MKREARLAFCELGRLTPRGHEAEKAQLVNRSLGPTGYSTPPGWASVAQIASARHTPDTTTEDDDQLQDHQHACLLCHLSIAA